MSIGIRLNSTSRENQGELSSKHEQETIDNDPNTSTTSPHDNQHYKTTRKVVGSGAKRVCQRVLGKDLCAKQSPLRSGPMTEYVIVIKYDPGN